jgi:hypothetical protein
MPLLHGGTPSWRRQPTFYSPNLEDQVPVFISARNNIALKHATVAPILTHYAS